MEIYQILTYSFAVIIVVLLFFLRNLMKQTESLEDMISEKKLEMYLIAKKSLENMRDVDLRGAFESDDEVGSSFKDIKRIIEFLKSELE